MKKTVLSAVLAAAMVLSLAACGGSGKTAATTAAAAAPATTAAAAAPAAETKAEAPKQDVIKLQIAHADPSNNSSPNHQLNYRFKELIEERSNGHFQIEVVGDAALGSENEYFAGLKMGTIQMCSCTNATISQNTKSMMVFDLPFIFPNNQAAKDVCQSDWAKSLWPWEYGFGTDEAEVNG